MESGAVSLLNPSRRMLVLELKDRVEATAEQLAAGTYLSVAAVRMHLSALERLKLVTHSKHSNGPGRPSHIYRLTDLGEQLFPQGYAVLLAGILQAVRTNPEWAERLWELVEDQQTAALSEVVTSEDSADRISELVECPQLQGFFPRLEPLGRDEWSIQMRHCPIIQAARDHPRVCTTERRIFQRVLGDGVVVTSAGTRPEGETVCSLVVRLRDGDSEPLGLPPD